MEYTFTLKYQLIGDNCAPEALVEQLGEGGCEDALVGIGLPGRLALEFTREAVSPEEAFRSALADVRRAIPTAKLIEAAPDLVGLTDVADLMGVSRQNMRKLMLTHQGNFPVPVHTGSSSIWHLADLLAWMHERGNYALPEDLFSVAREALRVNATKEGMRVEPSGVKALEELVA